MKIRKLLVKNFRGIKELDWNIPNGSVYCFIGKGDSSKSTILDALGIAFSPHWNLTMTDADFHQCNTDEPILIEATIGELTDDFFSLQSYGSLLRGWEATTLSLLDEPDDGLEQVLTIRFTLERDLEPKWIVVCDRNPEGVPFKRQDRTKVSVGTIGAYSERQLSWATGTALSKLTDAQSLNELLAKASRSARQSLDDHRSESLKSFDEAAKTAQKAAKQLGVPVAESYLAHLDLSSINLKVGGLALHDGDIPLRQLGLGSRRMLLCGIQQKGLEDGHVTLIDEVEYGLEPHRISRLIKHIREDKTGQYFMATHSPTVLKELTYAELYIVHNIAGIVQIVAPADDCFAEYAVQGKIRSSADAFLSRKVVVCEGATEVGFVRGFDDNRVKNGLDPYSYFGVSFLDAGGADKIQKLAKAFKVLGYSVAVIADGDAPKNFSDSDAEELTKLGIQTCVWSDMLCLEDRAMADLPWSSVIASVRYACDELGFPTHDQVCSVLVHAIDRDVNKWADSPEMREAIGKAAKKGGWFKDIARGSRWFEVIASAFVDENFVRKDLAVKLNRLSDWAEERV